jgi:hypothetical protein
MLRNIGLDKDARKNRPRTYQPTGWAEGELQEWLLLQEDSDHDRYLPLNSR